MALATRLTTVGKSTPSRMRSAIPTISTARNAMVSRRRQTGTSWWVFLTFFGVVGSGLGASVSDMVFGLV
jgi:hypothetical protein